MSWPRSASRSPRWRSATQPADSRARRHAADSRQAGRSAARSASTAAGPTSRCRARCSHRPRPLPAHPRLTRPRAAPRRPARRLDAAPIRTRWPPRSAAGCSARAGCWRSSAPPAAVGFGRGCGRRRARGGGLLRLEIESVLLTLANSSQSPPPRTSCACSTGHQHPSVLDACARPPRRRRPPPACRPSFWSRPSMTHAVAPRAFADIDPIRLDPAPERPSTPERAPRCTRCSATRPARRDGGPRRRRGPRPACAGSCWSDTADTAGPSPAPITLCPTVPARVLQARGGSTPRSSRCTDGGRGASRSVARAERRCSTAAAASPRRLGLPVWPGFGRDRPLGGRRRRVSCTRPQLRPRPSSCTARTGRSRRAARPGGGGAHAEPYPQAAGRGVQADGADHRGVRRRRVQPSQ